MSNNNNAGKIEGEQVYIISENIKNDGKIISTGTGAKTYIKSRKYSGRGSVESNTLLRTNEYWLKKNLREIIIGLLVTIIGGLILNYLVNWI